MKIKGLPMAQVAHFNAELGEAQIAQLEGMREAYNEAVVAIIDKLAEGCGDDGLLRQHVVQDLAMFAGFYASFKMVEAAGLEVDKRNMLSAFNYLLKRQERNTTEQIIAFVKAVSQERPVGHA